MTIVVAAAATAAAIMSIVAAAVLNILLRNLGHPQCSLHQESGMLNENTAVHNTE